MFRHYCPSGPRERVRVGGEFRMLRELRRGPRVPIQEMILALPDGQRSVAGNVSLGGFGFESSDGIGLEPGDRFLVRLTVPDNDEPLEMAAELCHLNYVEASGTFRGGARFVDVDELSEYPLFRYVEEAALVLLASATRASGRGLRYR